MLTWFRNHRLRTVHINVVMYLQLKSIIIFSSYFPSTIIEQNKLYSNICRSLFHSLFEKKILEFNKPHPNSIFNASDSLGLAYLIRLHVILSHFYDHKFRNNFRDSLKFGSTAAMSSIAQFLGTIKTLLPNLHR